MLKIRTNIYLDKQTGPRLDRVRRLRYDGISRSELVRRYIDEGLARDEARRRK